MEDASLPGAGGDPEPRITLLAINETYWLYEGEEFLNAMLMGKAFFPVPVRCMMFQNAFELRVFVGTGRAITDFWGINPDIVARLRRDNHLIEIRNTAV